MPTDDSTPRSQLGPSGPPRPIAGSPATRAEVHPRSAAAAGMPRAPAWRLAGFGRPASLQHDAVLDAPGAAASGAAFHANPLVRIAQLVAAAQGVLAIVTGVNVIRGAESLKSTAPGMNITGAAHATVNGYGIATLVIGTLLIAAGMLIGRPSRIARAFLSLWGFVAFFDTLIAVAGGGSVLGFVTVAGLAAGGWAILPGAAVLSIEAVLFYAMAVHPSTYRDFAERGASSPIESALATPYRPGLPSTSFTVQGASSALQPRKPRMASPPIGASATPGTATSSATRVAPTRSPPAVPPEARPPAVASLEAPPESAVPAAASTPLIAPLPHLSSRPSKRGRRASANPSSAAPPTPTAQARDYSPVKPVGAADLPPKSTRQEP